MKLLPRGRYNLRNRRTVYAPNEATRYAGRGDRRMTIDIAILVVAAFFLCSLIVTMFSLLKKKAEERDAARDKRDSNQWNDPSFRAHSDRMAQYRWEHDLGEEEDRRRPPYD